MHIAEMTVGPASHPAFQENVTFPFNERVNVFTGPNASGKTSLLRVLAAANLADGSAMYPYDRAEIRLSENWVRCFESVPDDSPLYDHVKSIVRGDDPTMEYSPEWLWAVPCVFVPATRITLPNELDWDGQELSPDDVAKLKDGIEWPDDAHTFDGKWVGKVYKFLHDDLKSKDISKFNSLLRTARIAHLCAARVSNEVLVGEGRNYVSNIEYLIASEFEGFDPLAVEPYVHVGMGTLTKTSQSGGPIEQYVGDLSAGTQGALLWVLYLGLRMMSHYEGLPEEWDYAFQHYGKRWDQRPAILLIDEIENHLHPTWQRRVIPALLEHFPGLQIFATTHSPFVVAGLKKGQVHMLKRDANGVVRTTPNEHDIIGWTTDEILRTFMEVHEPTDQLTIDRRERLLELRGKDSLNEEEGAEMAELRRQVNEDFLSSSTPLEAQRERYGDMMLEFLRSRQSDLSQDGS